MARLSRADITTIASRTGRKVVAAWSDRDAGAMGSVVGVVMHHTGTSQAGSAIAPTLQIVREGRSDLPNALSTYYIDKAGTIYLITEKIAWHAGAGAYKGITDGNGHFLGIEAESDGKTWTTATVDAYVALVAEICRFLGADVNTWAIRHATWATPTGRKTDFAGLSEANFKARAAARINGTDADMPLTDDDVRKVALAVWGFATSGQNIQAQDRLTGIDNLLQTTANRQVGYGNRIEDTQTKVTALQAAPAAKVNVDAAAVAAALASDPGFLAGLAKAVNDDAAKRLAS